ncbi:MAG: phospholipase D-like domain-containing protein, partial [Candidatus Helarchaeota archaeon]
KEKVEIEIITLPADSYRKVKERGEIIEEYSNLKNSGIKIFENIWEIGDPTLSTTSMSGEISEGGGDKWYSLHGKLLITEKTALIMSANFTKEKLYEVYLKYNTVKIIDEFQIKFQELKKLFITPVKIEKELMIPGNLITKFDMTTKNDLVEKYKSSNRIIVKEYSPNLAPIKNIEKGLKVSPFDGRARDFLKKMIENAKEFIYLLSERLFDNEIVKILCKKLINDDINVKILTGPPNVVRQNVEKARTYFKNIAICGGKIRALDNFHAKCWLTDKWLMVGSPNLTKMNLGIKKSGNYWRANTEILFFEDDKSLISKAKREIDTLFQKSMTLMEILGSSNQALQNSKNYFDLFDYPSRKEAKIIFAKIKLKFNLDNEKNLILIARYASKLARKFNKKYILSEHVIMGTILILLKERSNTFLNMYEKLKEIVDKETFQDCLNSLLGIKLIEKNKDLYELNVDTLLN